MTTNRFGTMVLALLLAASLGACKKKGEKSGGGATGVAECDDYLARMEACANKVGTQQGEGLKKMAAMMEKSWKEDVKDAEMKKEMPGVCKSAIQNMQKQLPQCDWGIAGAPAEGSAAAPTEGSAAAPAEGSAGSAAAAAPEGSGDGSAAAPAGSATP